MGISAQADMKTSYLIIWKSATTLRGSRFFHTIFKKRRTTNMKEFWNMIQLAFTAVGGF